MRISSPLLLAALLEGAAASLYGESTLNHTCQLVEPVLSCSPGALPNLTDSCCSETFGGLVLSTQFWDTYTGLESAPQAQLLPRDSWTLHGLWPDFCNGSFTQYCDLSRQYDPAPSPNTTNGKPGGTPVPPYPADQPGVASFLPAFGRLDLLSWMNTFWVAQAQPNEAFWAHEFSKHATCYSTFDVACYGPAHRPHEEVVDFFATAVSYFRILPTWGWLAAAGITPSNTTGYALADVQAALAAGFGGSAKGGARPYVGCSGPKFNTTAAGKGSLDDGLTQLSEVWYYHHVYGRPQARQALRVDASVAGGSVSNCAKAPGAVWYYERAPGSVRSSYIAA